MDFNLRNAGKTLCPTTWLIPRPSDVVCYDPLYLLRCLYPILFFTYNTDSLSFADLAQTPADVIRHLPVHPPSADIQPKVPVFLLTSAFAHWADPSHYFFQESISHIFEITRVGSSPQNDIYAVFAVVDKIPGSLGDSEPQIGNTFDKSLSGVSGHDGLSLLFANQNELYGEVAKAQKFGDSSLNDTERALAFSVFSPRDSAEQTKSVEFNIRVANTLFLNGRPRTLIAARWGVDAENKAIHMKDQYELVNCRIRSTGEAHVMPPRIPLHPVTQPRTIMASMGNILSQISKADGSDAAVPASTELEKAIPEYIKTHDVQDQRLAVWAYIQPDTSESNGGSQKSMSTRHDEQQFLGLHGDARLHRVVSGGGGWGKKQGLLSLDPECNYQTDKSRRKLLPIGELFGSGNAGVEDELDIDALFDEFPNLTQSEDGSLITPLAELAKVGNSIQFFVASLDDPQGYQSTSFGEGEPSTSPHHERADGQQDIYAFGVIPPLETSHSQDSGSSYVDGNTASTDSSNKVIIIDHHFGALSETGITYNPDLQEGNEKAGGRIKGGKIDVPGSRITLKTVYY